MRVDLVNYFHNQDLNVATYAKVSRETRSLPEIRSSIKDDTTYIDDLNHRVAFEYGHSSVLEHAVASFDVIGLSRYALLKLCENKHISLTVKSQRYCGVGEETATWTPDHILGKDCDDLVRYKIRLLKYQKDLYDLYISRGYDEKIAKEESRMLSTLCEPAQLGLTINARALHEMSTPCKEVYILKQKLVEKFPGNIFSNYDMPECVFDVDSCNGTIGGRYQLQNNKTVVRNYYDNVFHIKMSHAALAQSIRHRELHHSCDPLYFHDDFFIDSYRLGKEYLEIVNKASNFHHESSNNSEYYTLQGHIVDVKIVHPASRPLDNYIKLRSSNHAQKEIRNIALKINDCLPF